MVGFLLQDDAQNAQQSVLDDFRRRADELMASAQQQVTSLFQPPPQAAPQPQPQAAPPSNPALDDFRQQADRLMSGAGGLFQQQPAPQPIAPPPSAPEPNAGLDEFRRMADAVMTGSPLPPSVAPAPAAATPPQPPALEPAHEPIGPTTVTPLNDKWSTSFDFGQTYTGSYRTGTPHRGIDLIPRGGSGIGTEVDAFTPGTVTNISRDSGAGGLMVYVQDDQGLTHAYMHLADTAPGLAVGQRVGRGTPIATMGESGTEGSPHLHYEVRKNAATGDPLNQLIDPRPYMAGNQGLNTGVQSTAGLSGGGAQSGQVGQRGQDILSGAADIASWLGDQGQKALQAILITEGGLNNARGDNGQSAGPLQFFEGGQLANFARATGQTLQDAKTYVEQHPLEAIQWAIGTPTNPGYLGMAIAKGIQQNMVGADLATFAQRTGQVSESPERAGQNWQALFGGGQSIINTGVDVGRQIAHGSENLVRSGSDLVNQTSDTLRNQFANMQSQGGSRAQDLLRLIEDTATQRRNDFDQTMAGFRAPDIRAPSVDEILDAGRTTLGRADVLSREFLGRAPIGLGDWQAGGVEGVREQNPADQLIRGVPGLLEGVSERDIGKVLSNALAVGGALTFSPTTGGAAATRQAIEQAAERAIPTTVERTVARGLEPALTTDVGRMAAEPTVGAARQALLEDINATAARRIAQDDLMRSINADAAKRIAFDDFLRNPANYDAYGVLKGFQPREALTYDKYGVRQGFELPADVALPPSGPAPTGAAGRQAAQASVPFAAHLGTGAIGGAAGYLTAPEGATEEEKLIRAGIGAGAGLAGGALVGRALDISSLTRGQIGQVENLLKSTVPQRLPMEVAAQSKTFGQNIADVISSNLLSGPGLIWNTLTGAMHLGWQPIQRVAEGHPIEAWRGLQTILAGVPDALEAGANVVARAQPYAGVGGELSGKIGAGSAKWAQVLSVGHAGTRLNLGGDAVMRTLNERMAAMLEAQRVIRASGAKTPEEAAQIIQQHAAEIQAAATREGNVAALTSGGAARSSAVQWLSNTKTSLLQDSNGLKQALGVLLHVAVPFARVPEEILYQVTRNSPVLGNLIDVMQAVKAAPGDAKRTAVAKAGLNGAMTAAMLAGVISGKIRGPDDLEHPNTVELGGNFVPLGSLGTLGGRMGLIASVFDGWRKGENEPEFMARIDESIKNVLKFGADEYPLVPALKILSQVSRGEYGSAVTGTLSDVLSGLTPVSSGLAGAENIIDPNVREAKRTGLEGIYEPNVARIPGLANLLPERVDLLTGKPQPKPSSGPGSLLRVQNANRPLLEEFANLNRAGYRDIKMPDSALPKTRTVMGVEIPISTAQAQQIQAARGRVLANYARVLENPNYDKMTDLQKAFFWQQALAEANRVGNITGEAVAMQTPNLAEQVRTRRRVAGRLVQAQRRELELAGA